MTDMRRIQIPAVIIHTTAETSNSETTLQTQQPFDQDVRLTEEQEVNPVGANVDVAFPEATDRFGEERIEGIIRENEAQPTRDNQIEIADQSTDVCQRSVSSSPSLQTDTRALHTEPTGDNQMEGSISPGSSSSTDSGARWTEPVVNVLNWFDHALARRPRGVTSPSWQHGYRAGIRATISTVPEHGPFTASTELDLLPEPLFSNSPPGPQRRGRTESIGGHGDVIRRESSQERGVTSDTVSGLDNNDAAISSGTTPHPVTPPFVVLTTTPGRPRVTSILSTASPSFTSAPLSFDSPTHTREPPNHLHAGLLNTPVTAGRPTHHVRYPSAPLVARNENIDARPSRSSMMEYARATEDVNDMRRFGDEAGTDEIVPGGLVRGSSVGGIPKRRSSVLRRVIVGRRERASALYSSGLTEAVEEDSDERMREMLEGLGRDAARREGGEVRKLLKKGKKRLSALFN